MSKYLITNTKKGTYDITNPLTLNNLVQVGKATDILIGDYLPISGGEMTGTINFNNPNLGLVFGGGSSDGYIHNDGNGQVFFGSTNLFNFYETDTNTLAVQISADSGTVNAINGFEWNGQSLDDRYDNYGSWKLSINNSEEYLVTKNANINLVGTGGVGITYGDNGIVTFTSQNTYATSFGFNDSTGYLSLSGNNSPNLTSSIKLYDHRVHGLGTTSTINGIGRNKLDGSQISSFNEFYQAGFHTADVGTNYTDGPYPQAGGSRGAIINFNSHASGVTQLFSNRESNELWFRDGYNGWKPWVKLHHTGNLTKLSQLQNDLSFATSTHQHDWSDITGTPTFYGGWRLSTGDGSFTTITDNTAVTLQGAGGTNITRNGNVITFTSSNDGVDGNNYLTGATFNSSTGLFTFNRNGLTALTENMDGRYSLLTHTHTQYEPTFTKNTAFNRNFGLGNNQVLMGEKYAEWLVGTLTTDTTLTVPSEVRPMGYYTSATNTNYTVTLDRNNALQHFKILNEGSAIITIAGTSGAGFVTDIITVDGSSPQIRPGGTAFISFTSYFNDGTEYFVWNVTGDLVGSGGGASDGNNYPTSVNLNSAVLTIQRNGLSPISGDLSDGTIDVTSSISLSAIHNGKTLICVGTLTITIPLGLPTSFSVNILNEGSTQNVVTISSNGVTLRAPHGTKLLSGYTCNIMKRTGFSTYYLQGELTT